MRGWIVVWGAPSEYKRPFVTRKIGYVATSNGLSEYWHGRATIFSDPASAVRQVAWRGRKRSYRLIHVESV